MSDLLFIGIDSEGWSVGDNEMWHMWLGWRHLISNKLYILQCINLFRRVYLGILTFCANCILDSCSAIHTVYSDQPTNQQSPPAQCSVSATPSTGTWRQLNMFIDVLCAAVHSWLLTAALLWCWRLTRPALCWICAGVDRCGVTDGGNMSVVSVGAEGYTPNPPTYFRVDFRSINPCKTSVVCWGALLPITGKKYQFAIVSCNLYKLCVQSKDQEVSDKKL